MNKYASLVLAALYSNIPAAKRISNSFALYDCFTSDQEKELYNLWLYCANNSLTQAEAIERYATFSKSETLRLLGLIAQLPRDIQVSDLLGYAQLAREEQLAVQRLEITRQIVEAEKSDPSKVESLTRRLLATVTSKEPRQSRMFRADDVLTNIVSNHGKVFGPRVSAGYDLFDEVLERGLFAGSLIIYAADTGGLKTTLMLNQAMNLAQQGTPVLFVPLEWDASTVSAKLLCMQSGITFKRLSDPTPFTPAEQQLIQKSIDWHQAHGSRFSILDYGRGDASLTLEKLRAAIEVMKDKPKVVFLDYVTLVAQDKKANGDDSLYVHYEQVCQGLRAMGADLGFAVVTNAQLTREAIKELRTYRKSAKKEGGCPLQSDCVRGGHGLSMTAEAVFAAIVDEQSNKLSFYCIKNRHGPRRWNSGEYKSLQIGPSMRLTEFGSKAPCQQDDLGFSKSS